MASNKKATQPTVKKAATKKAAPKKAAAKKTSKPSGKQPRKSGLLPVEVRLISAQEIKTVNGQEIAPNYELKEGEIVEVKTIKHYAVFVGEKQKTALADKNQCQQWADGIKEQQQNMVNMYLEQGKTKKEAEKYTNERYK